MSEHKKAEPYENDAAMWRGYCADYGVITARIICREYLKLQSDATPADELAFMRELRGAMEAAPNLTAVSVYLHGRAFAELTGDAALYEESERANRRCADDIDTAVYACEFGDGTHAFDRAVAALREQYGLERVRLVLAAEAAWLGMTGQVSKDVGDWAHDIKLNRRR